MKIAVLLFGHLRDFERCADSLRNIILDNYDCDVFLHTWDETEPSTFSWHGERTALKKLDKEIIHELYQKYLPKKILIEHQEKFIDEQIIESKINKEFKFSTAGLYFMFYSMSKANNLRIEFQEEHSIKYDLIIVTRPDVKFKKYLDIEKILQQAEIIGLKKDNCRFFAAQKSYANAMNAIYLNEPNDLLFFGCPNVIDRYIKVNKDLNINYIKCHSINIVSVFTAREIDNGLLPVPISYTLGLDWSFSGSRSNIVLRNLNRPAWVKTILIIIVFLLRPVFKLYERYPFLNFYE